MIPLGQKYCDILMSLYDYNIIVIFLHSYVLAYLPYNNSNNNNDISSIVFMNIVLNAPVLLLYYHKLYRNILFSFVVVLANHHHFSSSRPRMLWWLHYHCLHYYKKKTRGMWRSLQQNEHLLITDLAREWLVLTWQCDGKRKSSFDSLKWVRNHI